MMRCSADRRRNHPSEARKKKGQEKRYGVRCVQLRQRQNSVSFVVMRQAVRCMNMCVVCMCGFPFFIDLSVFCGQCKALQSGKSLTEPFSFLLRKDMRMWIVPHGDRVVCIFGLDYPLSIASDKIQSSSDKIIANQVLSVCLCLPASCLLPTAYVSV